MSKCTITLKNVNKTLDENIILLEDVNYTFHNGNLYLLKAKSGLGKTTLLTLIGKLEDPTSGTVLYKGLESSINMCSFLFTDHQCFLELTGQENLNLISNDNVKIKKLASRLRIDNILHKPVSTISKGEAARLGIIRVLLEDKPVILLDEPTGNLDEENTLAVYELLKEYSENKIIISVSHDYNDEFIKTLTISDKHLVEVNDVEIKDTDNIHKKIKKRNRMPFKAFCKLEHKVYKQNPYKIFFFLIFSIFLAFLSVMSASFPQTRKILTEEFNKNNIDFVWSSEPQKYSYQIYNLAEDVPCLYSHDNCFYFKGKKYLLKDNEIILNKDIDPSLITDLTIIGSIDLANGFSLIANSVLKETLFNDGFLIGNDEIPLLKEVLISNELNIFNHRVLLSKDKNLEKNKVHLRCSAPFYEQLKDILTPYFNQELELKDSMHARVYTYIKSLEIKSIRLDKDLSSRELILEIGEDLSNELLADYFQFSAKLYKSRYLISDKYFPKLNYKGITTDNKDINKDIKFYTSIDDIQKYLILALVILYIIYFILIIFIVQSIDRGFRYNKILLGITGFSKINVILFYFVAMTIPVILGSIIGNIIYAGTTEYFTLKIYEWYFIEDTSYTLFSYRFPWVILTIGAVILVNALIYAFTKKNYLSTLKRNKE